MTEEKPARQNIDAQGAFVGSAVGGGSVHARNIAGGDIHEYHYQPPDFPLDNLPLPNPNFSGRAGLLKTIHANFSSSSGSSSPVVITQAIAGLGGVGKTQLALAYAHAHRGDYDLIWLLRADEPATVDGDLRGLGMVLNLPLQTADAPTARQMVLSWLNGSDKRWLLLYDNADTMTPRDLRPYLPGGSGHVLITSRRTGWQGAQTLRLDVFTVTEALAFWQRRLVQSFGHAQDKPGRLNQSHAHLAEELGYLPLALEQAAAYMIARQKSAVEYLALYRARRRELWQRQPAPDDYDKTITTTWEMAFEYARQTRGAAELLNLCCFLAPDDIPLDVIAANANALPEELAAVLGDELARDDALAALTDFSLVTRAGKMLAVHRLVGAVARDQMGAERAKIWAEAAVNLALAAWPFRQYESETWAGCIPLLPHLQAAADWADAFHIDTADAADLNGHIVFYLSYFGDLSLAQPFSERALAISERVLGPDHPDTAVSLNNLGYLLQAMGELAAAKPYYERALAIRERVLGPDHPHTAGSVWWMGVLAQEDGDLATARSCYQRALTIFTEKLGPEHSLTKGVRSYLQALT